VVVAQPAGRVTLVFTDIEGSTRLLRELGEAGYREALETHRNVVRQAFGLYRGYEAGSEGDASFYAFASAADAVEAAAEALARLEAGPVRIRVGVHSGEPGLAPPSYVGLDVHKAARVTAVGNGGQVLLSEETRALIGDHVTVRYLGQYRLKDLPQPERLYQLGLGEFPPLRTLVHTNLPVPATTLLGRERELAEVADQLLRDDVRLMTLTGPGGTGKTRLALQGATSLTEHFPDGVRWVGLAPLRDPALVLLEVARVLEINQSGREPSELLPEALAGKRLLLLLDNAEHLLPGAVGAFTLLRDIGGPKLLVTSRERLRLAGEHVYQVPSLGEAAGVALFTAHARALNLSFQPGPTVSKLCARLDNLPLGIELAAARTVALSPEQILERISEQLDLLRAGRDADPRHQTLRSTIEWSYRMLTPDEQRLFARLAVFAGGATLEATEQVCRAELDTLATLVDKSLVRKSGERFWMLETIREFALEQLESTEDASRTRHGHAVFYDHLATEAGLGMRGGQIGSWLERLAQELPNLRSAMAFSLAGGEPSAALRISASVVQFWAGRAASEGRDWINRSLVTGAGTRSERSTGFYHAGRLAFMQGDADQALALFRDAIDSAASSGDDETLAAALGWCGSVLSMQGRKPEAIVMMRRCQALAATLADPWARSEALAQVAAILSRLGDFDEADKLNLEVLTIERALDHRPMIAVILSRLGYRAMEDDAYSQAQTLLEESLGIARELRDATLMAFALGNLGLLALLRERYREAVVLFGEDLELCSSQGNRRFGAEAIWGLAAAHAFLGNSELAVKLDTIHKSIDNPAGDDFPAALIERVEPHLRRARDLVDPAIVVTLKESGRPLNMESAISELERLDLAEVPPITDHGG
jgi:predicted ATPase/class 3 adenylate cyclase